MAALDAALLDEDGERDVALPADDQACVWAGLLSNSAVPVLAKTGAARHVDQAGAGALVTTSRIIVLQRGHRRRL